MTTLPNGWALASLEELSADHGITDGPFGSNLKTEHYRPEGPRVVRLQNIGDGVFRDDRSHISLEHFEQLSRHAVEPEDVLVASLGEVLPRACLAPANLGAAIVKADCIRVRPAPGVSSGYLMWALNAPATRQQVGQAIKGVGRPRINLGDLRTLAIPAAPLPEQERIVAAIEEAFSNLDAGESALLGVRQRLKRMRDAVLAAAFSGVLVPQDPAETPAARLLADHLGVDPIEDPGLGDIPKGWAWVHLGAVLSAPLANGRSVTTRDDGFPVLRLTCLRDGRIDLAERKGGDWEIEDARSCLVEKGDFLVSRGNGSLRLVGRGGLVTAEPDPVAYPDTLIRVRVVERVLAAPLLALWWNSGLVRRQLEPRARTTAGIYKVNQSILSQVALPIPAEEEQSRIVTEVERQLSFIEACERAVADGLARSSALRRSVLKTAFDGALVPQDPTDEPVSVLLDRRRSERAAAIDAKATRRVRSKADSE